MGGIVLSLCVAQYHCIISLQTRMKLFFLLCLLGLVLADEIEIIDCGSKVEILSITFDGCSGFPCVIHKGETATGQVTMVARSTTDSLTCKIVGIIPPGIELPFNGCPVNACQNLSDGDCPVQEDEMIVYDMSIPVLAVYPAIEIEGKWMLKDDSGEDFLCFRVPMKIEE